MPQPDNNLPDWQHYARAGRTIAADPAGLDAALAKLRVMENQVNVGTPAPQHAERVYVTFMDGEAHVQTGHEGATGHYPQAGFIQATLLALLSAGMNPDEIAQYAAMLGNRELQQTFPGARLHWNPPHQR